ncbi:hypothetical protein IMSAGC009_04440 [Lachnospiraceae bacterium]|nr:hypothetical protein IMSAGC009_04440 [Lachnospiraceae bacterium]
MRINFYDARIADDSRTILVKEKGINCESQKTDCPEEISRMLKTLLHMDELAEEHIYMIALNHTCKILGMFLISKGTVSESPASPREIFIRAALIGAVQIILCHNHPSGNPVPSECDMELTKRLKAGGELLNIRLADHIIIGRGSYLSFKEAKLL